MSTASRALSASVFLFAAAAGMAFGDDLKGYSIDATYTAEVVPGAILTGVMPRQLAVQHHDRLYISLLGNVFVYSDAAGGGFTSHNVTQTQLDKEAKSVDRQRVQGWTVEPGRLLRVEKDIEGIRVTAFAVDPSKTTCSLSYELHPDAKTGRTVIMFLNGVTAEITAENVRSVTCTVRKGNIFASDQ